MNEWETVVELGDLHERHHRGEISIRVLGELLIELLKKNKYADHPEIVRACERLKKVRKVEQYDRVLEQLYNFGDYNRRIWFAPETVKILIQVEV
jgi:hypothetical protein